MNSWIVSLLGFIAAAPTALALLAAAQGNLRAVVGALSFLGFVGFIAGAGWFHFRFPLPPRAAGEPADLLSEWKRFRARYPGWPSAVLITTFSVLAVLFIAGQVFYWKARL